MRSAHNNQQLLEQLHAEQEREARAFLKTITWITLITLGAILFDMLAPGRPF